MWSLLVLSNQRSRFGTRTQPIFDHLSGRNLIEKKVTRERKNFLRRYFWFDNFHQELRYSTSLAVTRPSFDIWKSWIFLTVKTYQKLLVYWQLLCSQEQFFMTSFWGKKWSGRRLGQLTSSMSLPLKVAKPGKSTLLILDGRVSKQDILWTDLSCWSATGKIRDHPSIML